MVLNHQTRIMKSYLLGTNHLNAVLRYCACSETICRKHGRICIFPRRCAAWKRLRQRLHTRPPRSSWTEGNARTEAVQEHTPGELWSAATPTSWSSKHRHPRAHRRNRPGATRWIHGHPLVRRRNLDDTRTAFESHFALGLSLFAG